VASEKLVRYWLPTTILLMITFNFHPIFHHVCILRNNRINKVPVYDIIIISNRFGTFRSIGLPAAEMAISPGLAAQLSKVPDFLLSETCYAYCQISNRHRLPKYRNTFVLEEGSSLTLVCAEATADKKVYSIDLQAGLTNHGIINGFLWYCRE